ncbi:thiolase family protein [Peribacillus sp. NPDC046944]|uniref:thiolase family protein n=1 Tax=unclassified Peribacillus TaxID=2675266 RepID=UPI003D00D935
MRNVVIVDAVRTPIATMGGTLKEVEVDFLAASVIDAIVKRSNLDASLVDEVILGQAKQSADSPNLARLAALRAGLPVEVAGYTVHRQCGSGLQSIINAVQQIQCGQSDIIIAGGAESMSTAPYYMRGIRYGLGANNGQLLDPNTESQPRSQPEDQYGKFTMGLTAENLVEQYGISREKQDSFAFRSQSLALKAIEENRFADEIIPYKVKTRKGTVIFDKDEYPRQTTPEKLAELKPVFKKGGSVTAGNSSGRNDGASAVLLMSEEKALKLGLKPRARIIGHAAVGVSPEVMGIGPVPATKKALQVANISMEDLDLIELNEAFAAQALAVIKEWDVGLDKINVNGGAIALGHPLGATGAILLTKILYELERRNGRYGLVTLCIGGGMGISAVIETMK